MLITLLQDCISMLFNQNTNTIYEYIKENDAEEVYNTLMKNFGYILLAPQSICYNDIFCSDKEITPKLFYFKWKLSNKEKKEFLINDVKKYHKQLLFNHNFPFIFKFILLISRDEKKVTKKILLKKKRAMRILIMKKLAKEK